MTPAAESFVEVELASLFTFLAEPQFDVTKPVACDIDGRGQNAHGNSSQDQNHPYMTCVE